MNCACCKSLPLVERVGHLLDHVKAVGLDELEHLVQVAHESDVRDMDDPPQRFPITRQALRMFWMFRRNLEAVEVRTEVDE
jgi:hypothetical protein